MRRISFRQGIFLALSAQLLLVLGAGIYFYGAELREAELTRELIVIGLGVFLGIGLVSHYLTVWLLASLRRIAESAHRLRAGQMDFRIEVDRTDEFGQLALTFNEMAASLEASYARLEDQVRDRTAELTRQNQQLQDEILERKRAESALAQQEIAYRDLFEYAPVDLWLEDYSEIKPRIDELVAAGITELTVYFSQHQEELDALWEQVRILDVNQSTMRTLHATHKEQLMPRLRPMQNDEQRRSFAAQLETLAQGRTRHESSSTSTRLDGEKTFSHIQWSVTPGHEHDASKVLVVIHDLTELKQASDLNHLQSTALHATVNSIVITDRAGTIQWVNPAFTRLTGYTAEEAIGNTPRLLRSIYHPKEFYDSLWQTITSGQVWRGVIHNRHKDGTIYLEQQTITPVYGNGDEISHYVAIKHDVTEQVRTEEALRRKLDELQVLQTIATLGTQMPDEETIIQKVTQVIGETFYPDHFGIMLLDPSGRYLLPHASYQGVAREALAWRVALSEGVAGYVASTGLPLRVGDVTQDARFLPATLTSRSELCVPLLVEGAVLGVINAESQEMDAFGPEDERLLVTIAGQLATAIERARLFAEAQERNQELTTLHDLALSIGGILKADDLLRFLAERLRKLMDPDTIIFVMYDEVRDMMRVAVLWEEGHYLDKMLGVEIPLEEGGLTKWVIGNRSPLLIADLDNNDSPATPRHITRASRSWLGVPLMVRGQIIGAVSVQSFEPGRFNLGHQHFMESLASQAAIAIENATLFDEIQGLLSHAQAQTQQVQQIIETVPGGVLLLDTNYRVVLGNPTALEQLSILTGHSNPEIITFLGNLTITDLLNPLAKSEDLTREVIAPGEPQQIFEVDARPMQRENVYTGWVVVLRDVTQDRRHQEYLHAQERLATVGQLAAGIAHDFNNIMGAIVLYAQMLNRQADLSPKHKDYIKTIREQAQHATNLIRQILDFSRRSVIERQPLDLEPFLASMTKLLTRTLPENIEVVFQSESQQIPVRILGDATRLQQAMMNLAVNARDAMPKGGHLSFTLGTPLTLEASSHPPLPDMPRGKWVQIQVKDSGEGITAQNLAHIFEPFYSTKPRDKGTGLGLAQVYGIVKQHEGYIGVESHVGEGTTFHLYLPVVGQETDAELEGFDGDQLIGGSGTILIAEDNHAARVALQHLLEGLGFEVLAAADGEEALAIYGEHGAEITVVLSDMVMPKLGGMGLYQALVKQNPQIKLIIMTGYPQEDGGTQLLEQGIVDWLPKPFGAEDLMAKLSAALEGAEDQIRPSTPPPFTPSRMSPPAASYSA